MAEIDPNIYEEPTWLKIWQTRLGQFLGTVVGKGMLTFLHLLGIASKPIMSPYLTKLRDSEGLPEEVKGIINMILTTDGEWQGMLLGTMGGTVLGGTVSSAMLPGLEQFKQFMSSKDHFQLLPVESALRAKLRGTITQEQLEEVFDKLGFHDWQWPVMQELVEGRLDSGIAISLFRRFNDKYPDILDELRDQGWTEERIEQLKDATLFYPGPGDLVNWQAKEVFEPQMIEKYGLDAELGSVNRESFYKAGMDDEQITNFWRAHWQHASWSQVLEMLHRKLITEEDVRSWFRLVEIPPYWRQKMIDSSYDVYTRVDVRRMHKLGIIDDAGLIEAYMNVGYNAEKAENMAAFTIAYNADPEASEQTETDVVTAKERDLTKSEILKGYRDGLLEESEARYSLGLMGYSTEETDYYITRVEYDRETDETNAQLKYYHDAYIRGIMTHNEIVDRLGALNVEGTRQERLFAIWDLEKSSRVSKPTKAEILTFLRKEIITIEEGEAELLGLGYTQKYVDWYMQTI